MNNDTFAALGCAEPFLTALDRRGFTTPTPVQAACFGPGLEGRDLLVQSRTGSGKTLAFGLPLMHRLEEKSGPQALVLAPTRELAQQVSIEMRSVRRELPVSVLVGGMPYGPQLRALSEGSALVVGTPGRVMDHLERGTLDLSSISMVVLDECDEMLNLGFFEDVKSILSKIPGHPQTYLFSATLPGPVANLADRFLKNPERLNLSGTDGSTAHADIAHTPCLVPESLQQRALVNLLLHDQPVRCLVFTKTKQQTETLAEALRGAGLAVEHLHGDLNQNARSRTLAQFKAGRIRVLVATDVAARGLDIEGLPLIVHMGIPTQLESYIHRSGRTGRAGAKGTSLALVGAKESRILKAWARRADLKLDWRTVPTPADIRLLHEAKLVEELAGTYSAELLAAAARLLEGHNPQQLVAALLARTESTRPTGHEIPASAFREEERPRPSFSPRPNTFTRPDRPGYTPRPAFKKDDRPAYKKDDRPGFKAGPKSGPKTAPKAAWAKPHSA